jgi:hypothetical protein
MWCLLYEDAEAGAENLDLSTTCPPSLPPCWDFAVRNGIFSEIAGYAALDFPSGMMEYALGWFDELLSDLARMDAGDVFGINGYRYITKLQTTAWRSVEQLMVEAGSALYVCDPSDENVDAMMVYLALAQTILDVAADAFRTQTSLVLSQLQTEVVTAIMRVALQCIRYEDVQVRRRARPIILELLGAAQRQYYVGGSRATGRVSPEDKDNIVRTLLIETGVMNVLVSGIGG